MAYYIVTGWNIKFGNAAILVAKRVRASKIGILEIL